MTPRQGSVSQHVYVPLLICLRCPYSFTGEKFVFKDTGKIKAQMLPERYKKLFLNKQIVCYVLEIIWGPLLRFVMFRSAWSTRTLQVPMKGKSSRLVYAALSA